jgi:hypothetical protein
MQGMEAARVEIERVHEIGARSEISEFVIVPQSCVEPGR